jgi:serine/threonine protein kinase/predicted ATPase
MEPLTDNATLSHYRIVSKIGAGGMGEVYLAEDTRLERRVAIKLLPADLTRDLSRVRRFEQEARAASALNHPNIVTIHEIGEAEVGRFIVLEYVRGHTLRAVIEAKQSLQAFASIGRQVARALSVAHQARIVHRDIKPENIMIRDDGYVKVLDFGLARLSAADVSTESSAQTAIHTRPGSLVGTLSYMSPEQVEGEAVESESDIFSLGIVFYEMATGQKPFKADSEVAVMHAIAYDQPLPPSQLTAGLATSLEQLILGMLDKNPRLRPTADEVASALAVDDQTISSTSNIITMPSGVPSKARNTVGRETERYKLRAAFESARAGRGMMVCITGEAGLGKTTLVEDFFTELSQGSPSCQLARGRSSERLAGAEAYLPFLEALDSLTSKTSGQPVARIMKTIAPTWYLQLATSQDSSVDRVLAETSTASQERMKRELVAFLQEIAARSPLVLFFDDLHWADASTIEIIAYLATRLATIRLLIVAAYRSSEMLLTKHPFLSVKLDMQGRGLCQEMPLEFLAFEDVERFLALEFPRHGFPKEFASLIYSKTEGSPLFMADVVRYLRDREVIGEEGGRWMLVRTVPEIETDLPESVRSMIERKIAQLGDEERRLLVAASAQGYSFDSAVVARALDMDAAEVEERLQALDKGYGFVKYRKEDEFPDHTLTVRYQFIHVLYQNALYATLTPSRRASMSAAIAKALLEFYGKKSSDVASELAFLFQAARDWSLASDYFLKAARNATRVFANQEAVALSQRGLEMTGRLPDSTERTSQELRLQMTKGFSLMMIKGFAATDTVQAFFRGRELSEQSGEDVHLFRALFGLSIAFVVRGEYEKGRKFAEQELSLAERCGNEAMMVQAHWALALCLKYLGEFIPAREHFERSLALYDHQRHAAHAFLYGAIVNRAHLGRLLAFLGYPAQGQAMTQEALSIAAKLRHPVGLCQALSPAIALAAFDRNVERVNELNEQILFHADEHGLPHYKTIGAIMRGWVSAMQGEAEQGSAEMLKGLAAFRNLETEQRRASYLVLMADSLLAAERVDDGLRALDDAIMTIGKTGEHFYEAELYRVKADLLLKCKLQITDCVSSDSQSEYPSPQNEAEACYEKSIEIARRQRARAFELRAATGLARLWRQQGKACKARQLLAETYGWFTEGFDSPDLKDARALLDQLQAPSEMSTG